MENLKEALSALAKKHLAHEKLREAEAALQENDIFYVQCLLLGAVECKERRGIVSHDEAVELFRAIGLTQSDVAHIHNECHF